MEDALIRMGFGLLSGIAIAVPALGMTLMWTSGRVLNLAFSEILTLGAFVSLSLWGNFPIPAVIAVTAIATGLCSVLMYVLVFQWLKQREVFVSLIASLGIAFLLNNLIIAVWGTKIGRFDLPDALLKATDFGPLRTTPLLITLALLATLTMALVAALIYRSDFGLKARAASQHVDLAEVTGIPALRVTLAIWMLAGVLGGLGGMAIGMSATVFPSMGSNLLLIVGAAVLLGGLGSPVGAVSGALIVGIATELSTIWITASLKPAVAFAMIALVLLVRPGGLTNQKVAFKND